MWIIFCIHESRENGRRYGGPQLPNFFVFRKKYFYHYHQKKKVSLYNKKILYFINIFSYFINFLVLLILEIFSYLNNFFLSYYKFFFFFHFIFFSFYLKKNSRIINLATWRWNLTGVWQHQKLSRSRLLIDGSFWIWANLLFSCIFNCI